MNERKKAVVLGVLGVDAHVVRNKIMAHGYWQASECRKALRVKGNILEFLSIT
jgi:methylmalonyl-CoA mutase cobalamin-binding subunit